MVSRIKEKTIMNNEKKIDENTEDKIMLGKYAGLTSTGKLNEDGEPEFIGTEKQWEDYENVMHEEVLFDEDNNTFFIGVGSDRIDIA